MNNEGRIFFQIKNGGILLELVIGSKDVFALNSSVVYLFRVNLKKGKIIIAAYFLSYEKPCQKFRIQIFQSAIPKELTPAPDDILDTTIPTRTQRSVDSDDHTI